MNKVILQSRTQKLGIEIILLTRDLPKGIEYQVLIKQLIRCATSVGANYRAACRAKSTADFINKLKIVEEEADETVFFLEIINAIKPGLEKVELLMKEANEILAIVTASLKTLRSRNA